MKKHKWQLAVLLIGCLLLGSVSTAYGAIDAAEGFDIHKAGEFNEITIVYGDSEGRGIAVGSNYELTEQAVAVTEKPEGAKAEVYFTSGGLKDFNTTGKAKMMAYCDKPGKVAATILLTFTDPETKDTKFVTGTVEMNFRDASEVPEQPASTVIFTVGSAQMISSGQIYDLEQAPFIENDRLYVPLRAVSDVFGLAVVYNQESGYIRLTQDTQEIVLAVDSPLGTLKDGQTLQMDVPVLIRGDRACLPVRYISQILGYDVSVTTGEGGGTQQVIITR